MRRFLYILCFGLLLTACHTQTKIVPVVEYRDHQIHDTIKQIDSISHWRTIVLQGETVHIHDSIDRWRYKERIVEVYIHDSIPYEVEVTKEVRIRNGYDKFTARGFWSLLAIVVIVIGGRVIYKIYFKQ